MHIFFRGGMVHDSMMRFDVHMGASLVLSRPGNVGGTYSMSHTRNLYTRPSPLAYIGMSKRQKSG